jgi:hypothetical protein
VIGLLFCIYDDITSNVIGFLFCIYDLDHEYRCNCFYFPGKRCNVPLGMQSSRIPNSRITASSIWDANHGAHLSRLQSARAWCVKTNNRYQWIQVDFGRATRVTKFATQGRKDNRQWVTRYTLSYSQDGAVFVDYKVKSYAKKVCYILNISIQNGINRKSIFSIFCCYEHIEININSH